MSSMSDMTQTSLAATERLAQAKLLKIIKNYLRVFERGKNLLQNGILHFVFKLSQSSEIVLQS